MITNTNLRIRVAHGMAWLKENGATYQLDPNRIDLDAINMADNYHCILGQSFTGTVDRWSDPFSYVADQLEEDNNYDGFKISTFMVDHGFDLVQKTNDDSGNTWNRLAHFWREALAADRMQQAAEVQT